MTRNKGVYFLGMIMLHSTWPQFCASCGRKAMQLCSLHAPGCLSGPAREIRKQRRQLLDPPQKKPKAKPEEPNMDSEGVYLES